ncbi:MAG: POTRA domain-containing protein, partial [Desulfomonilia bacterium]|nr:POTRA domain-containing protein [Desulfomonilia bacterium]
MKQAKSLFLRTTLLALAALMLFPGAARAIPPLGAGDLADLPEGTLIEEIVIVIEGAQAKQGVLTNLAADLIVLKQGHPLDRALLEESLDALALSTAFTEIRVQSTPTERGHAITFILEPLWLIRRIHVSGQFPLFEKEILNAMTVSTGDSLDMETLQTQETLIEELYRREGFISPTVTITPRKDRDRAEMDLSIRIERGPFYAISPLTIRGNRAFGDSTLLYKMDSWWMSLMPGTTPRFREAALRRDIRSLTEFYWKQGYPECDIDYTLTRIDEEQRAAVMLSVSEGPRYEVSFSGNSAFSDRALTGDLLFFSEGNRRDRMLRRSIDQIRERYHAAGYPDVSVELEDSATTEEGRQVRRLEFTITEGRRTTVESVEIVGNEALSDKSIGKQILTRPPGFLRKGRFVEQTLLEDLYAVKTLYLKHGYAEVLVEEDLSFSPERDRVRVRIAITEGPQTLISAINFEGLTVISEDQARAALMMKEGDPLQEYLIRSEENTLSTLISEKGYPYVQVRSQVVHSQDRTRAELFYRIEEHMFVTMGNIYYRGNFKTSRSILDKEIAMEPGEPFSLKGMLDGQKSIRDMEIFNSVRFKTLGLREQAESITLLADLEEIKPYYLRSGFGYESDRGFYAQGRVGDRNIFGRNKSAWVGGEISQIGYRVESGITEPRLFGYRMLGTLG